MGVSALKQTWIDKGLRHVTASIHLLPKVLLKQTWIDKGLRLGERLRSVAITNPLKQTWIDKGLRLIVQPFLLHTHLWLLKQTWIDKGLRHGCVAGSFVFSTWNWNRPELIRDYDLNKVSGDITIMNSPLKQTWIDKGLRRRVAPFGPQYATCPLKQTWIDKGLRQTVELCFLGFPQSLHWNRPELIRDYDSCMFAPISAKPQLIETDLNW